MTNGKRLLAAVIGVAAASCAAPALADCENATNQVGVTSNFATGPGHCDREVILHFRNSSDQRVVCVYALEHPGGGWEAGQLGIRPGGEVGGEGSGNWTCNGTGNYRYYCAIQPNAAKDWTCQFPNLTR